MFDPDHFRPGDLVVLVHSADPFTALQPGATGTVRRVDDAGTVHVQWDDGHRLGMVPDVDDLRLLGQSEDRPPNAP